MLYKEFRVSGIDVSSAVRSRPFLAICNDFFVKAFKHTGLRLSTVVQIFGCYRLLEMGISRNDNREF